MVFKNLKLIGMINISIFVKEYFTDLQNLIKNIFIINNCKKIKNI